MQTSEFNKIVDSSKKTMREIWQLHALHALNEQAVPSYLNPHTVVSNMFWKRVQVILNEIERMPHQTVLDYGCGIGTLFPFLDRIGVSQIIAYDNELHAREGAQKMASEHKLASVEVFDSLDALRSLPDQSVDAICALDVLEHVDELDPIMKEFNRLLKIGGSILVSGPTENILYRTMRKLGGEHYRKHFHVRNIYDIRNSLEERFNVKTVANLWPFPTFFHICKATKTPE